MSEKLFEEQQIPSKRAEALIHIVASKRIPIDNNISDSVKGVEEAIRVVINKVAADLGWKFEISVQNSSDFKADF
jgi:hypothetical protein